MADWVMVGITAVYVVATIIILIWNIKSVKVARTQIEVSLSQFEDSKRLQTMPFLQLEVPIQREAPLFEIELPLNDRDGTEYIYSILAIKNVGNGTATSIDYSWEYEDGNISEVFPISAISTNDKYIFQVTFLFNGEMESEKSKMILWEYKDLLGNTYEQQTILSFVDKKVTFCENDIPQYLGIVKYSKNRK